MGERAPLHITIGGTLPRGLLSVFTEHVASYDLRTEWDGEPFDPAALPSDAPLELFGTELNGGHVHDLEAFCTEHGLAFRRWSGGCLGVFLPGSVLFAGRGAVRTCEASEDGYAVFSASSISSFRRLRDLKRAAAHAELTIPPFVVSGGTGDA